MGKAQKTKPKRLPKLCRNKNKDFAYVTDPRTGNQIYMGQWGLVETQSRYAAWLADFVKEMQIIPAIAAAPPTIGHLATRWLDYCRTTYRRADGRPTGEVGICQQAASLLMPFADQPIDEFSRAHLISIRDQLVATGKSRSTIKHYISRIVRMFKFGSDREWIDSEHILRLENPEHARRPRSSQESCSRHTSLAPVQVVPRVADRLEKSFSISHSHGSEGRDSAVRYGRPDRSEAPPLAVRASPAQRTRQGIGSLV